MRKAFVVLTALATVATVVTVTAGVAGAAAPTTVNVKLKEFKVLPSVKTVKAGKVTFVVANIGKINHEMVVVKTNVAPGKLKENAEHEVSEKGAVGEVVVDHGKKGKVTLTLKPGKYQLLCNLPSHYTAGQYAGFTVK
jgi:uncharacterized cupredoxin-like copper-binding protein